MRLIDADNLKAELFDANWLTDNDEHMVEEIVERQSTVDTEPVRHGRWETKEYTTEDSFDDWIVIHHEEVCSECGKGQGERSKFCPNCGAKMDEGEQNAAN